MELWSKAEERRIGACRRALAVKDLAGALLAVEGAGPLQASACRDQLMRWGEQVAARRPGPAADARATALRVVLGALRGDDRDYYEPRNVHLSSVVERGQGMPIALSAVWMVVGEAAGIPVEGVGMPGHFVARIQGARPVLVDPFRAGRTIAPVECRGLVERLSGGSVSWKDSFLEPTSIPGMVERVLRNLVVCHTRAGEDLARYRTARFIAELAPDSPVAALLHARIADEIGLWPLAVQLYGELAEHHPESPEGRWASGRRAELASSAAPLH